MALSICVRSCAESRFGVLLQRRSYRLDQALGLDLGLAQGTTEGIVRGMAEAVLEHGGDFVVGKAIRWLDLDAGFMTRRLLARVTDSNPSASTWKLTRIRAAPATIGGMPRNSKRARLRQSDTSSRSPCTTCTASAVWPSL
jgi:hypothetical protein